MKIEQGVSGLLMIGVAVLVNGASCGRCSPPSERRMRRQRGALAAQTRRETAWSHRDTGPERGQYQPGPAGDTIGNMREVVVEDPWLARLDRMRRLLPLPLLLVSAAVALFAAGRQPTRARSSSASRVAAAAVWWLVVTARLRSDASTGRRLAVFAVHTALAGVLVWVSLPYGVFAYTGFLLAYGLGSRWRTAASRPPRSWCRRRWPAATRRGTRGRRVPTCWSPG